MAGRILVLDDEENYAVMLKNLLCEHNYQVDLATRPERAISQIEEIPYDLIISDYKMPVMDGSDFLKKSRELYPNLPFILVSGLMNTPELVKVANMSVTLVMEKPIDTKSFLEHVARFSDPMTEEEKAALGETPDTNETLSPHFPAEPHFVSAQSAEMKKALQQAWAIAESGQTLHVFDPAGGDADLLARDLSRWRGNEDTPPGFLKMPETSEQGVTEISSIVDDPDQSDTILVRLDSEAQLMNAGPLAERAFREIKGADSILIVFALAAYPAPAKVPDAVRERLVELPPLISRPVDLAFYAHRFLKMANERMGRQGRAVLSPEAVCQILSFDWHRGYRQIQSILSRVVEATEENTPVQLETLQEFLGVKDPAPAPGDRLSALMKRAQGEFLKNQMELEGWSPAEVAKEFELGRSIRTEDDLMGIPLVREELATL